MSLILVDSMMQPKRMLFIGCSITFPYLVERLVQISYCSASEWAWRASFAIAIDRMCLQLDEHEVKEICVWIWVWIWGVALNKQPQGRVSQLIRDSQNSGCQIYMEIKKKINFGRDKIKSQWNNIFLNTIEFVPSIYLFNAYAIITSKKNMYSILSDSLRASALTGPRSR